MPRIQYSNICVGIWNTIISFFLVILAAIHIFHTNLHTYVCTQINTYIHTTYVKNNSLSLVCKNTFLFIHATNQTNISHTRITFSWLYSDECCCCYKFYNKMNEKKKMFVIHTFIHMRLLYAFVWICVHVCKHYFVFSLHNILQYNVCCTSMQFCFLQKTLIKIFKKFLN